MKIQALASSSRGNCYRIDDGKTPILIEAGLPIRRIREGLDFRLQDIQACLVTHEHSDHCRGARALMEAGIDCWMSAGTAAAFCLGGHRLHIARAGHGFQVGSWAVMPFTAIHDAAEPLGFLLASGREKLLFLTDSAYVPARFAELTHVMIEANYQEEILQTGIAAGAVSAAQKRRLLMSHMNLENVCRFLETLDCSSLQEVWLLHASDSNSDAAAMIAEISKIVGCPVMIAGEKEGKVSCDEEK